jgi:hypothetical protein
MPDSHFAAIGGALLGPRLGVAWFFLKFWFSFALSCGFECRFWCRVFARPPVCPTCHPIFLFLLSYFILFEYLGWIRSGYADIGSVVGLHYGQLGLSVVEIGYRCLAQYYPLLRFTLVNTRRPRQISQCFYACENILQQARLDRKVLSYGTEPPIEFGGSR